MPSQYIKIIVRLGEVRPQSMQSQYIKIKVNHKLFTVPSAALQDNTNETIKQLQLITVAFKV